MRTLKDNWMSAEYNDKNKALGEILTTKEVERLYDLPINTVVRDIRRGKVNYHNIRQSGKVWLITRDEANRMYSNYQNTRARQ